MSIYTSSDGEVRVSIAIVGMLAGTTIILAMLAWQGHQSLSSWAFGDGVLTLFALACTAPGWIAAFWYAYIRRLPDDQIESKRHAINVVVGWLAVIAIVIGAKYLFWPDAGYKWTRGDIAIAVGCVVGAVLVQRYADEVERLRSRCALMERRVDALTRAINSHLGHNYCADDDEPLDS